MIGGINRGFEVVEDRLLFVNGNMCIRARTATVDVNDRCRHDRNDGNHNNGHP